MANAELSVRRLVGAASAAALPCPGLDCWAKSLALGCCWGLCFKRRLNKNALRKVII